MARQARPRRPAETRERILAAATEEFAARGLGGARVDAIADRAAVNKRMLYHYFGSKDSLFTAVLEGAYADIRAREDALDLERGPPRAAMARLVRFTFRYFLDNPHFVALLNSENLHRARHIAGSRRVVGINSPLIAGLGRLLARGVRARAFRAGVDPLQLYVTIAGICYFYFSNVHTLSAIFARDLAARPALRRREAHVVEVVLGFLRR